MKKFLLLCLLVSGCCSYSNYVAADRATLDAIAPVVSTGIAHSSSRTGRAAKLLMRSWEARVQEAERE